MKNAWAIALLFYSSVVLAGNFNYRVEINGIEDKDDVLLHQLDIDAWHDSDAMNLDQLQRLHQQTPTQLQDLLATEGYFSAQIQPQLEQDGDQWVARYTITSGVQAQVDTVSIQFEGALQLDSPQNRQRQQKLQTEWPLQTGAAFKQSLWREGKKRLLEDLNNEDYPYASIKTSAATVSDDGKHIDLAITLDSGPAIKMGHLVISGLINYPEKTVNNLNTIAPGSSYKREELLNFQSRLIESGYFSGVLVRLQQQENHPDIADLQVQVTELKKKQIRIGLGFSTDSKERVQLGYEDRNILDRGWRWNVHLQADRVKQSLSNEITLPSDPDHHQDSVGHTFEHTDLGANVGETFVNRLYGKRRWGNANFERSFSLELIDEARHSIVTNLPDPPVTVKKEILTANITYNWIQRNVDDLVFPTRGQILDAEGLVGTQFKLSPYYRLYGRWNRYIPLKTNFLFLSRLEAGQIFGSPEDPPSDYMFLAGGDNSIRGYSFHSIGHDNNTATLGSATMGILSLETQYWFSANWGGAIFFDAGSLGKQLFRSTWYPGYGAGLRWRSPVGPLNLDYAWGQRAHDYQIHFSIGLAF